MRNLFHIIALLLLIALSQPLFAQTTVDNTSRMIGIDLGELMRSRDLYLTYSNDRFRVDLGGGAELYSFDQDSDFEFTDTLFNDLGNVGSNHLYKVQAHFSRLFWKPLNSRLTAYYGPSVGFDYTWSSLGFDEAHVVARDQTNRIVSKNKFRTIKPQANLLAGARYQLGKRFSLSGELNLIGMGVEFHHLERSRLNKALGENGETLDVRINQINTNNRTTSINLMTGGKLILGFHF